MREALPRELLGLLGLLLACGGTRRAVVLPSAVPPRLAVDLEACMERSPAARDWCAVALFQADSGAWGPYLTEVCPLLGDAEARGRCLELAMRGPSPPPAEVCETLPDPHARASCAIYAADVVMAEGAHDTVPEILELCAGTAPLQAHCLVHGVWVLEERWARAGAGVMAAELGELALGEPAVLELATFGEAVGTVARRRFPRRLRELCGVLGEGAAGRACTTESP